MLNKKKWKIVWKIKISCQTIASLAIEPFLNELCFRCWRKWRGSLESLTCLPYPLRNVSSIKTKFSHWINSTKTSAPTYRLVRRSWSMQREPLWRWKKRRKDLEKRLHSTKELGFKYFFSRKVTIIHWLCSLFLPFGTSWRSSKENGLLGSAPLPEVHLYLLAGPRVPAGPLLGFLVLLCCYAGCLSHPLAPHPCCPVPTPPVLWWRLRPSGSRGEAWTCTQSS